MLLLSDRPLGTFAQHRCSFPYFLFLLNIHTQVCLARGIRAQISKQTKSQRCTFTCKHNLSINESWISSEIKNDHSQFLHTHPLSRIRICSFTSPPRTHNRMNPTTQIPIYKPSKYAQLQEAHTWQEDSII
eukprot:c26975_g1_i1 orf=144-536(+)